MNSSHALENTKSRRFNKSKAENEEAEKKIKTRV